MSVGVPATNLGFPRIGAQRELKRALEGYWSGELSAAQLRGAASSLRRERWLLQREHGIDHIPSNDFSLYDHVLDTAVMVGAVPDRYVGADGPGGLEAYFAMARGGEVEGRAVAPLEMRKWFGTDYHHVVPEIEPGRRFELSSMKPMDEFREAAVLGVATRPVVLGPISFLHVARQRGADMLRSLFEDGLLDVYEQLVASLASAGATWVQIDEPAFATDLDAELLDVCRYVYGRLAASAPSCALVVATYFSDLRQNLPVALTLPVAALHLDVVAGTRQLDEALALSPRSLTLSLGVVDGRNVWRSDLEQTFALLQAAESHIGPDRLLVAPSCSLLHLPVDTRTEDQLAPELRDRLAFAVQRLDEVALLVRGLRHGREAIADALEASARAGMSRAVAAARGDRELAARLAALDGGAERRASPYEVRREAQAARFGLPELPTTTIGAMPQTRELRRQRARRRRGELVQGAYDDAIRVEIASAIAVQEIAGLDVLVHGEFERGDMVEYFAEHLEGFALTANGWVQSYGSRLVKPPIIVGDVVRRAPIAVEWTSYAQSLTDKPVKGILTGPMTMLAWSFVRDDCPPETVARQLALAVRDEAADLEAAGIGIIQIDEPALRQGLPMHEDDRPGYLHWAVDAFRLASAGLADSTQLHTHMCYDDLEDIVDAVVSMDVDVLSVEAAGSHQRIVASFAARGYRAGLGPGVWDVRSPRAPSVEEIEQALRAVLETLPADQVWVNPDCGLKTRDWDEVTVALDAIVEAAVRVRGPAPAPGAPAAAAAALGGASTGEGLSARATNGAAGAPSGEPVLPVSPVTARDGGAPGQAAPPAESAEPAGPPRKRHRRRGSHGRRRPGPPSPEASPGP